MSAIRHLQFEDPKRTFRPGRLLNLPLITVLASCYPIGHLQRPNQSRKQTLQQNLQEPVCCPRRALTLKAPLSSEVAFTEKAKRVIVEP